jgi:DNA-binding GntR family transcriptional regulator
MYERLRVDRSTTVDRVVDALRSALFAGDLEPGTP